MTRTAGTPHDRTAGVATTERLRIRIGGMSCSFCTETVRKAYARMDGVEEAHVSLAHEEALIRYDPDKVTPARLEDTLRRVGYTVRDPDKVRAFEEQHQELEGARRKLTAAGALTGIGALLMSLMWLRLLPPSVLQPVMLVTMPILALATVFGVGRYILAKAYQSLRRGILNQHVLLEFGALAGLLGGALGLVGRFGNAPALDFPIADFFVVAVFLTSYHILSEYTSLLVRVRASRAVQKLLDLQPDTARVLRGGEVRDIPVGEVEVGDRVRVLPGESIPVDGRIVEGRSAIDESVVTGESIPTEKGEGDEVVGGAINGAGSLVVAVTRVGDESFLQRVARSIEEARAMKPGVMRLVDVVLKYYVPGVIAFAALALLLWTVGAWAVTGEADASRAIFAMLAVFVLGYPCALGMATPLAMIRGGGLAAERGILMRSGEAFQVLKDIRTVVLDKTGTLTRGEPAVTDVVVATDDEIDERSLVRLAASVEDSSEHPLGRAIVEHAAVQGIAPSTVEAFEALTGKGVRAEIEGATVYVGKPGLFTDDLAADVTALEGDLARLQEEAKTVVVVGREDSGGVAALGLIAIADPLKDDAERTIEQLRELGLEPVVITGDNRHTAEAVAARLGIDRVSAGVLPHEKANEVHALQQGGARVAFVGDGINDAPALMQADVGVAIGTGTDVAIESSDIILMGGRLAALLDAFEIGRNSHRKTVQNLALAFSFNGIGVPLAVTGLVHPVWAMIAMVASVSTVLANSFGSRLLSSGELMGPSRSARRDGDAAPTSEAVTLHSKAIHCAGCVARIENALEDLDGVQAVEGSAKRKEVTVAYEPAKLDRSELVDAMRTLGYRVDRIDDVASELARPNPASQRKST